MPQKVMEFLAHKITSNVRELEGALNRIAAHMQLVGRDITLESAQEVLHDLLRSNERRVTIDEIQRRVAEHFNIKLGEMTSDRRARAVARPRQVAMYLAKAADLALAAGNRPQVRRPRPHHGHARGPQDRGADAHRPGARRGCRAAAPDAAELSAQHQAPRPQKRVLRPERRFVL